MTLSHVKSFWSTEACGTHFVEAEKWSPKFFEQYTKFRYETEWHIQELVPFAEANGKNVLEIGCGNGADGVQFALNGARYTGVDLTETAVQATQKHFESRNLVGKFKTENAEALSFADESFDWVYSHGVLHHTAHPQKAIDEVYRVLKPGGRAIIMLYHKNSFNYWIRISGYMRGKALVKTLSRMNRWKSDRKQLDGNLKGIRGNDQSSVWQLHYEGFLKHGWRYLSRDEFTHHATDGPECPYAFTYTKKEALKLFSRFENIKFNVAHFPLRKYLGKDPIGLEKMLAPKLGWYLFIDARKN